MKKNENESLLFPISPKHKQSSDEDIEKEMLEGLQNLACNFGRVPTAEEINEHPLLPSTSTYIRHFGSLKAAYQMAGIL